MRTIVRKRNLTRIAVVAKLLVQLSAEHGLVYEVTGDDTLLVKGAGAGI